jgi:hypothetical protein
MKQYTSVTKKILGMLVVFLLLSMPVFAFSNAGEDEPKDEMGLTTGDLEKTFEDEMASISLSNPNPMGSSLSQDKYSMWVRTLPSTHFYSVGLTPGSKMTSGFGVQGSYDLKFSPVISVGLQVNAFFEEGSFSGDKTAYVGPRLNIYLLDLMSSGSRAWDLYAGLTVGVKEDANDATFDGEIYFGVRWNYAVRWSLYTEVGNGAVFGIAFNL